MGQRERSQSCKIISPVAMPSRGNEFSQGLPVRPPPRLSALPVAPPQRADYSLGQTAVIVLWLPASLDPPSPRPAWKRSAAKQHRGRGAGEGMGQ